MILDFCRLSTYYRGRVALCALLRALGVGPGSDVGVQAFTCVAVPEGILAAGAKPIFVDISPGGLNMASDSLEERLTPNTRAIVVQHTFGIPCDMASIMRIASERGIFVIEDCCHTLLSKYHGQQVGSFGVGAFFSFEWGKPVAAGIGGAAIANSDELHQRLVSDRSHYSLPGPVKRTKIELQYALFGLLYRPRTFWSVRSAFHTLSKLGAAEGNYSPLAAHEQVSPGFSLRMAPRVQRRVQRGLLELEEIAEHSRRVVAFYRTTLNAQHIVHPEISSDSECLYARYPVCVKNKRELLGRARKANIELAEWYSTAIHPVPSDRAGMLGYNSGSCPEAERRSLEIVSLPTHRRVGQRYLDGVARFFSS